MIRLGLLMLATLAGLFIVLYSYGDTDLRADRRPAPAAISAAQDAGAPPLPDTATLETAPADPLPAETPTEILPATTQTAPQVDRFPGPPLQPSPEYAGATPPAAAVPRDAGPVLYVTATRVNMRSGAGTGNPVVAGLDGGTAVEALGPTGGDWVQIRTPQGQQGYVAAQFLSSEAP